MVQLGFVIDHSRCIGCHACTVACKSENSVPVGSFRTWVKYTEAGEFPEVKRSFAVLRCNQCTDAPCMTICPTSALDKRDDGIVDLDRDVCIGCKSCMQACPYDALYVHPQTGTAEKCHFCAHRVEQNLAPACAVVCPTEAIVPGDFDDPASAVSRMKSTGELVARKTEAGTGPNVFYKEVAPAGVEPQRTSASGGYIWADQPPSVQLEAEKLHAEAQKDLEARTTYDVEHPPMWGSRVSAYLVTKAIAAGALLLGALLAFSGRAPGGTVLATLGGLGALFLGITTVLLIMDLKRPERFLLILTRPNWSSWLCKGTIALVGGSLLATLWLALGLFDATVSSGLELVLWAVTAPVAAVCACYTAWLFGQAKGRVLWMRKGLALELVLHALTTGGAAFLIVAPLLGDSAADAVAVARWSLITSLMLSIAIEAVEKGLAPNGREDEYARAVAILEHGPYRTRRLVHALAIGSVVPLALTALPLSPALLPLAGVAALYGLWTREDLFVRAGQALRIS